MQRGAVLIYYCLYTGGSVKVSPVRGRRSAAFGRSVACLQFAWAHRPPSHYTWPHTRALSWQPAPGSDRPTILRRNTYYLPTRVSALSPPFIATMLAQLALPDAGSFTLYLTPSPTPAGQPTSSFDFRTGLQLDIQKYWKRTACGAPCDGDAGNINWVKGATVAFRPFSEGRYINRARSPAPNLARPSACMRSCPCRFAVGSQSLADERALLLPSNLFVAGLRKGAAVSPSSAEMFWTPHQHHAYVAHAYPAYSQSAHWSTRHCDSPGLYRLYVRRAPYA